jgi:hypothetical protein
MGGITIIASKAYWSPMASWSPRCFPDASQMPPRCFPDASQMLPRCFPDASRMRPRCFPDASSASSSPKWLLNALQKTLFGVSCGSHSFLYMLICLGTGSGVIGQGAASLFGVWFLSLWRATSAMGWAGLWRSHCARRVVNYWWCICNACMYKWTCVLRLGITFAMWFPCHEEWP